MPRDLRIWFPRSGLSSKVRFEPGGLDGLGEFVCRLTQAERAVLVTDRSVLSHHGARALRALRRSGLRVSRILVPRGERAKAVRPLENLWDGFASLGLDRHGVVVALGGGVVGDLAGFAAATWLRGVSWVAVPTTVVAQVDSSIGGKTAIDIRAGKNLIGAFHQPAGVLVDPELLRTLPLRHRRAGLAEVVKTGMAVDLALFRWIERNLDGLAAGNEAALAGAVGRSIRVKSRIVTRDEHDRRGLRSALNFGHTAGHAVEAALGYRGVLHGEAVAIGMRVAARLSVECARLPESERARLEAVLDRLALPRKMPAIKVAALSRAMQQDKKRQGLGVRWVLTPRIGRASVPRLVSRRLVRAALVEAGARA